MSELPPDALDYRTVVAEVFLGLRGSGLMLSPLDEEIVAGWELRGVPIAIVCRGLRRGVEDLAARGAGGPRSIRALRLAVEDEWRAYRAGRIGDAPAPPAETDAAAARLAAARERIAGAGRSATGAWREGYRDAWRALAAPGAHAGTPLEQVEAALASADARLLAAWIRSLGRAERRALGPLVRRRAGPRAPGASLRAHRGALRAHLLDAACAAGLTCLRGSV